MHYRKQSIPGKLKNVVAALGLAGLIAPAAAAADDLTAHQRLARDILKEMVEVRTVEGYAGSTERVASMAAARLRHAGFAKDDVKVLKFDADHGLLVARYRGDGSAGKKPILLMAHLDVVDALREDWNMDPFTLIEKDGYFYGRGSEDNKGGASALVATLMRMKAENYVPNRDIILLLSGDEETNGQSMIWLLAEHRDLIDAEFALNSDGGGGSHKDGEMVSYSLQSAEKVYMTVAVRMRNKGGHSSVPSRDNAIYRLSAALVRLGEYDFPVRLNETTRGYFAAMAGLSEGQKAEDMKTISSGAAGAEAVAAATARLSENDYYRALMRTTCVATGLKGGHAENALPQLAEATINCRMLPDADPEQVKAKILEVMNDPGLEMSVVYAPMLSPASPLREDVMAALRKAVDVRAPGLTIIPSMSTGATDGVFLRNAGVPVYGVAGLFGEVDDNRAHGQDERIGVADFYAALEHWPVLIKALAGD